VSFAREQAANEGASFFVAELPQIAYSERLAFPRKSCYTCNHMNIDDPRVSENLSELSQALAKINNSELIKSFLEGLLTPAERADIAARWALVKELENKVPQREIARNLGLSLCKITRGSRELKKENSPFKQLLDSLRN
jgi:TrpR family trp operon transcriptional repressor